MHSKNPLVGIRCWRLAPLDMAEKALDGDEARQNGGRWNSQGRPAVYASEQVALAVLELLAHADAALLAKPLIAIEVEVPIRLLMRLPPERLPEAWQTSPDACRPFGDAFLAERRFAPLAVPSSVLPDEINMVLNPDHPEFRLIARCHERVITLDRRLYSAAR